jgi:hypothetical protein
MAEMLFAALNYAYQGFEVFRLVEGGKQPLPGSDGFLSATSSGDRIVNWWMGANSTCNVGIATGSRSGIWVLDVDTKDGHDGFGSLSEMCNRYGDDVCETRTVETWSGGLHFYFRYPEQRVIGRRISAFKRIGLPHIDVCGDNGYVVGPPSVVDGRSYRLLDDRPIAPTPVGLLAALEAAESVQQPRYERTSTGAVRPVRETSTEGMLLWLAGRLPGTQDDALSWVVRALRDEGMSREAAEGAVTPIVLQWPVSGRPWTVNDVERHLRSAYR